MNEESLITRLVLMATVLVALGTSYAIKRKGNEGLDAVYYSGRKEVAIFLAYFAAFVIFSLSLPTLLR